MKKLLLLAGLVMSMQSFTATGDIDQIIAALEQGNAAKFSEYFDNFVDIKLPDNEEIKGVGKTQAGITMKNFFNTASIKGFEKSSQRENDGTMYLTGKLQGSSKTYSLTLLLKTRGDKLSVIKIRIN